MAGISVSGLISNSFDWKSVVDQLIQIDSAPVARLQTEEATNVDKLASLATLRSGVGDLQTSAQALAADGLFNGRSAASATAGSTWTASAVNGAASGNYTIAVSQLATAAQLNGANSISSGISATDDVSGVTLANMATSTAVTAGSFTVDGNQVTIALTDSLQDVFTKISAATGGVVTASYSAATDKITLASNNASEVILGASNDSSNFLSAVRLSNNGTDSIGSSSPLGSAALNSPLASGRLKGSFGGVDGSGNGTFSINGVSIGYNINTDSLSAVISRISAAGAGVTASYDGVNDRVVLSNNTTGDQGLGLSDTTGTLLGALGLTTGATLQRGKNALFTVNGGSTLSSASNTLAQSATGISGLSVTVNTESTQTINVGPNTTAMKSAIQDFITKFNAVQSYIDTQSKITTTPDAKVTTALLSDNREVQDLSSQLQSLAFAQVSGVSGTIQRLESMGIDFSSTDSTLSIKDSAKLDSVLASNSSDVGAFFNTASTGFAAKFDSFLTNVLDTNTGLLATQTNTLNKQNTDIDSQIATLNKRLDDQREQLTNAFLAMQDAQSAAQTQQATLTGMFAPKSSG